MKLKDKVVMVTGGSRGIGKGIAYEFLCEGAKVIICATRSNVIQDTVSEFKKNFANIDYHVADISKKDEVDRMFDKIIDKYGTVDVLINNAGITADAQLYKMSEEQWDNVITVNLKGTFNCCSAAAKIMKEKQFGKVINISSSSALDGNFGQTNYAASKAGMIGMTKSMAKELGKYNVNVNAIVPGVIVTDMTEKVPEKVLEMWKERTPLRRFGLPSDVAKMCTFLASEDASFITGEVIRVAGGFTL